MPLWDFRAHATWQTCLSSYAFTFLADAWKSHSAGDCIRRCRRLSHGCKPTREDSPRFWQRREVVRALQANLNTPCSCMRLALRASDTTLRLVGTDPHVAIWITSG